MNSLTEAQLRALLQKAYDMGWRGKTSYNTKRALTNNPQEIAEHDTQIARNRDEDFTKLINEV